MIPKCWPEILVIAAWFFGVFLIFRVSAFRSDQAGEQRYFGVPYFWNWKYFVPGNFTPKGRPLLYWLWFDTALFAFGGILAISICI